MKLLQTPSFELAVYQQGNNDADKLLLCLPGRLDTKDYANMRGAVEYFGARGYLAVSFDPPGTWESPGGIELYTMTNYLKAIDELITYFGNKPTVLVGHSRGGSVALVSGIKNKHVSHVIAVMSSTTPSQMGEGKFEDGAEITYRDSAVVGGQEKVFRLPEAYFEDASQYNPLEGLKTCTTPKLFIKGLQDTVIDPQEIDTAYAVAAEPKAYAEVDSEHYYYRNPVVVQEINSIISTFLEMY